jgi:hypothetical protein
LLSYGYNTFTTGCRLFAGLLENDVDHLKWELLTETAGRLQADLLKSHLEAAGIEAELFQEAVGRHIYPVTIDGLGRVQIFVPKPQLQAARAIVAQYEKQIGTQG